MKNLIRYLATKRSFVVGIIGLILILTLYSCEKVPEVVPVLPSVPSVTTIDATSITMTSVSSGGNISLDGGAPVSSRGICWGLSSNPTIANNKTTDGAGIGNFTSSITELVAGTTYNIRAYAINSVGTAYGNNVAFVTNAIMYPVTITAGANGTASSTLQEVASGSSLPITVTANTRFIPDSVRVNGVSFPLNRNITTYNLTNVTKATSAHFTFRLDLNAIINQKAWKKDSLWIKEHNGTWSKYAYEKKDSVFFLSTGRYAIYRDKVLIGDGNWSIIENFKAVPVLNFGGTIWDLEKLDDNTLITARDDVANIDPKITEKGSVKIIYKHYKTGK